MFCCKRSQEAIAEEYNEIQQFCCIPIHSLVICLCYRNTITTTGKKPPNDDDDDKKEKEKETEKETEKEEKEEKDTTITLPRSHQTFLRLLPRSRFLCKKIKRRFNKFAPCFRNSHKY